jgi:hypothetical protein
LSSDDRNSQQHPLLDQKLLAALAVIGVAAGVGITLMLARILIIPGLMMSLISALAIL